MRIPGTMNKAGFTYELVVDHPGTRSERRVGTLLQDGEPVNARRGDIVTTPWGPMLYFGDAGYRTGFLTHDTYDTPLFDDSGRPSQQAEKLIASLRAAAG